VTEALEAGACETAGFVTGALAVASLVVATFFSGDFFVGALLAAVFGAAVFGAAVFGAAVFAVETLVATGFFRAGFFAGALVGVALFGAGFFAAGFGVALLAGALGAAGVFFAAAPVEEFADFVAGALAAVLEVLVLPADAFGAGAGFFATGDTGAVAAFFSVSAEPRPKPRTRSKRLGFWGFFPAPDIGGVRCAMSHLLHCVTGSKKTLVKFHGRESCRAFSFIMSRFDGLEGHDCPRASDIAGQFPGSVLV
jgi:hypothetical protein